MSESKPETHAMKRLVSTEERDQAVRTLTAAFTDDAIPVAEFERRVAEVYGAEDREALLEVMRDLPAAASPEATVPARVDDTTAVERRSRQQISSVLSSVERRLDGPMPESLDVRSVMASVELDLRGADFPPGVTEIRVRAIMGNIELELPQHVRVEDEGSAFLGNFSVRGRSRERPRDGAPVVRITGRSILGNVEVELDG